MIISHAHKFIFFAVPKTGTQSVREALSPHLATDDWQQHALFGQARLPIRELAAREHGHLSVCDVAPLLPAEIWENYFKFAFVRNPYDRFVSAYVFLFRKSLQGQNRMPEDLTRDMKAALARHRFRSRILIQPQSDFLEDRDGELGIDFVGRYERLDSDFQEVCERLGISAQLQNTNPSEHAHYSHYYDDELRSKVESLCGRDFEHFEYEFESEGNIAS